MSVNSGVKSNDSNPCQGRESQNQGLEGTSGDDYQVQLSPTKGGLPRDGHTGACPGKFGISLEMETLQTLWAMRGYVLGWEKAGEAFLQKELEMGAVLSIKQGLYAEVDNG